MALLQIRRKPESHGEPRKADRAFARDRAYFRSIQEPKENRATKVNWLRDCRGNKHALSKGHCRRFRDLVSRKVALVGVHNATGFGITLEPHSPPKNHPLQTQDMTVTSKTRLESATSSRHSRAGNYFDPCSNFICKLESA